MRIFSQNLEIIYSTINGFSVRHELQLHKLSTTLKICQKAYYNIIKIFNKLTEYIVELVQRKKCFLSNLKKYLTDKALFQFKNMLTLNIHMRPDWVF
jgi:hypothetical protein